MKTACHNVPVSRNGAEPAPRWLCLEGSEKEREREGGGGGCAMRGFVFAGGGGGGWKRRIAAFDLRCLTQLGFEAFSVATTLSIASCVGSHFSSSSSSRIYL